MIMWHADKNRIRHPGYTGEIFETDKFQELVETTAEALRQINMVTPFDAVAGSGNSGALLCAAISYRLNVPLIAVRKKDESNCSGMMVTGHFIDSRYVILDDLISSGRTIRRIISEIAKYDRDTPTALVMDKRGSSKCVGIVLYHSKYCYGEYSHEDINYHIPTHFVGKERVW